MANQYEVDKCVLCDETRYIQNAHIVPKTFFTYFVGAEMFYGANSESCLRMCPNHHYFYDNFLLNEDEYNRLRPLARDIFIKAVEMFRKIDFEDPQDREGWVHTYHLNKRIEKFDNWLEKHIKTYGSWTSN